MQKRSSSKQRFFWFGGLSCLVVLIAGSLFWISISDWSSPSRTLEAFCQALVAQDYATAYAHLSPDYQKVWSYADFANAYRSNHGAGRIIACQEHIYDDGFMFGSMGILNLRYAGGTTGQQEYRLDQENLFFWKLSPEAP